LQQKQTNFAQLSGQLNTVLCWRKWLRLWLPFTWVRLSISHAGKK